MHVYCRKVDSCEWIDGHFYLFIWFSDYLTLGISILLLFNPLHPGLSLSASINMYSGGWVRFHLYGFVHEKEIHLLFSNFHDMSLSFVACIDQHDTSCHFGRLPLLYPDPCGCDRRQWVSFDERFRN